MGKDNRTGLLRNKHSIRTKLQLSIVVLVFISTVLIALAAVQSILESYETVNETLKVALEARYEESTKNQIETLDSVIATFLNKSKQQQQPLDKTIENQIRNVVRNAKYDHGNGYFFLYDMDGNVISHGNDPMLEGKNLLHITDPKGIHVIEKLRDAARQGGGFVRYLWNKPTDFVGRYKKISYAENVKYTPWWIGTGIYMDDVDAVITSLRNSQKTTLNHLLFQFVVLTVALIMLALFIAFYFAIRISKPIINLSNVAKKISGGDYDVRVNIKRNDELGDMANSFNSMAEFISQKVRDLTYKEHYNYRLLESIADGLMVTNRESIIVQVNPAAEKIFGYTKEELLNKNIENFIPKDALAQYRRKLEQVLQGRIVTDHNVQRYTKDGVELSLSITISPVIEDDQTIRYRIHSFKDMTEYYKLKNQIKQMENLKRYFPNQIVEQLIQGDGSINLGYDRRKVTIFFSDLTGFTELTDSMEAEEMVAILSEYLTSMSNIVYQYSGTLDKFIGDAIMVFFGAPTTNGVNVDATNCVNMALDMQAKLEQLNQVWRLPYPLKARIGINTGYATVGNFGSEMRLEYTIIGTPVNIASRLEHACEPGGILISHETAQLVKDLFNMQEREPVQAKGIHRLIKAFHVKGRLPS